MNEYWKSKSESIVITKDNATSVKGDRYFCLTSLAVCIDCKGCVCFNYTPICIDDAVADDEIDLHGSLYMDRLSCLIREYRSLYSVSLKVVAGKDKKGG